jgi:hypothetical protein
MTTTKKCVDNYVDFAFLSSHFDLCVCVCQRQKLYFLCGVLNFETVSCALIMCVLSFIRSVNFVMYIGNMNNRDVCMI